MEIDRFFYRLYSLDIDEQPLSFLGTCFPVAPGGNMMTCRHVVQTSLPKNARIGIYDNEYCAYRPLQQEPIISSHPTADLAFLPNALGRQKREYIPILTPQMLKVGEDVYSYGYFSIGGTPGNIESGYFAGKIVNFHHLDQSGGEMMTLPYAIIEGLSGSPVLTYHNGVKLVGVATGNRTSRIVAAETFSFKDERVEFRETINRIVEFGTAMHCVSVVRFLTNIPSSGFVVSHERISAPGLE